MDIKYTCKLLNSKIIYKFAAKLLYKLILTAKLLKIDNIETYINIEYYDKKNKIVTKLGVECNKNNNNNNNICKQLVSCKNFNEFYDLLIVNNITILQITGSFYKFSWEPIMITAKFDSDKKLQKQLENIFSNLYGIHIKYSEIKELSNKSNGDWFIPWLYTYGRKNRKNIVRASLNYDKVYIREALGYSRPITKKDYVIKTLTKKKSCIKKHFPYNINKIVSGSSFFKIIKNGTFNNIMKQYNKNIISGYSGSCIMIYQMVFEIYKIYTTTKYNKILLLLSILADFNPHYHSFPEVLVTYTREANFTKPYTLDMDEIKYLDSLLKNENIDLDLDVSVSPK